MESKGHSSGVAPKDGTEVNPVMGLYQGNVERRKADGQKSKFMGFA